MHKMDISLPVKSLNAFSKDQWIVVSGQDNHGRSVLYLSCYILIFQ